MNKIALLIEIIKLSAGNERSSLYRQLNEEIIKSAEKWNLKVPQRDYVGLAFAAARAAGAEGAADVELVAVECMERLLTRDKGQSSKSMLDLAKPYLRNTVLPNLVLFFKSKGKTLAEIKKDPIIMEILAKNNFRPDGIDRAYRGELKPNHYIADPTQIGRRFERARGTVWESFSKTKGKGDAVKYFYSVALNECRDILRSWSTLKHKFVGDALRIAPGEAGTFDENRHHEFSVDPRNQMHNRMMGRRFRQLIESERDGPTFWKIIELMRNNGWDFSSPSDARKFQNALGFSSSEFRTLQRDFLQALKRVLRHLDVDSQEEAAEILKVARPRLRLQDQYPELRWVREVFSSLQPS